MSDFKGRHFEGEIVLWAVRWYCRYGVSYRDLEQMMGERGVERARLPLGAEATRRRSRSGCAGTGAVRIAAWRVDETYIKVKGEWAYLYRAVDKLGNTIDSTRRPAKPSTSTMSSRPTTAS